MKKVKRIFKILLAVIMLLAALLLLCFIYHRIQLKRERPLLAPLGTLVRVNGGDMSVYAEGEGEKTLVFMSGGGTCSPILDFRSLYSLLSGEYKTAVVEKFGYGFSDITDGDRDIDVMLEQTRAALNECGIAAPYVLCPHSMSGIEALYWAQKYPDEVEAVIGLDMSVPQYYDEMKISVPVLTLGYVGARLGVTRFIPGIWEGDAVKYGTLTDSEKDIYRAVFYSKTSTRSMINEAKTVKSNAEKVKQGGIPQIPMLLFISDGSGGTGFDKDTWRRTAEEYISGNKLGSYVELDCPHYVHDHEYERISEEIRRFLDRESVQ
ncbi:MAG: alpha/beta hydrolase [Ruminococcus sp.]|nr:alpha/beta hydrolase [Ruminococcus sp.]